MFLGHASDIGVGYKKPLLPFERKKVLVNTGTDFLLGNNICPHQGSLIIDSASKDLVCQYHGWAWDSNGNPVGSGQTRICNDYKLKLKSAHLINNLLFEHAIDLNEVNVDFSNMRLQEERIDIVKTVYTNIVDVFLDVDHIPVVHDNVYDEIGILKDSSIDWFYYNWGSIQKVSKTTDQITAFDQSLLNIPEENLAAFWIAVYPGTMIEWQPGAMFITVCIPKDDQTNVCVYKYKDIRYNDENWKINSEIWETAWKQDRNQAESIVNPSNYHPHLEDSKLHFRAWSKNS